MTGSRSSGFTLRDMLIAVGAMGVLMFLVLPAIEAARESARRKDCVGRMQKLVLATHNYHDLYKQFPSLTSTQIRGVAPASLPFESQPGAGYHWQVSILPYLEQQALYDELASQSKEFSLPPFDSAVRPTPLIVAGQASEFAANEIHVHTCPVQQESRFASAPEYVEGGMKTVARCSYVALSATHLDCILGDPTARNFTPPNGIIVPGPQVVTIKSVVDGTSRTFIFVETCESKYSSWYDGTVGWAVAINPNSKPPFEGEYRYLTSSEGSTTSLRSASKQYPSAYLPATLFPQLATDWTWGPSSNHKGGVIVHGIADGSVRTISDDVDPTLYLRLVARAGRDIPGLPE